MTGPAADRFDALRLPVEPMAPRPELALDLKARLHRRLGMDPPPGVTPMRKAGGLEYEEGGNPDGEAVLFIHAGVATAYVPLMREPALADRYRLVRYHRRGYAGSDDFTGEVTIGTHARDAIALLGHLGIERAHVVGHSGSGLIALQVAMDAPVAVRSLALEEPAVTALHPRWGAGLARAIAPVVDRARRGDARGAIEMWMDGISPDWRVELARTVPCGPQQTLDDAAAFFADVDAVEAWAFDPVAIRRITQPVLYVLARTSRPYREVLRAFQDHVPQTEAAVIPDATHMLHTDQPQLVAAELSAFFARQAD